MSGLHTALEELAVGALMYEQTTPIAEAQQLQIYSDQYRSVVMNKGAMVFHMLRTELGRRSLHCRCCASSTSSTRERRRTIDEFEKLAATKVPQPKNEDPPVNLLSFFSQWLNSTGVPEFSIDYIVYRTPKGFKVVGKVHQDLDTFRMPVDVRVDTEGNPEVKKILVTGTTFRFRDRYLRAPESRMASPSTRITTF